MENLLLSTPRKIALGVFLVLLVIYMIALHIRPETGEQAVAPLTFFCAQGGSFQATFQAGSVALLLPDGRSLTLPQTMSGSGIRYESVVSGIDTVLVSKGDNAFITEGDKTTYDNCTVALVSSADREGRKTYMDQAKTFQFSFPKEFSVSGSAIGYSEDWSVFATTSGLALARVEVPQSYEPGTNFGDARFTVGTSASPEAVAACLRNPAGSSGAAAAPVTLSGVPFTKVSFTDAGAGNYYETTSYRIVRDGQCYAVEYTIHSMQIGNYTPGAVRAFDREKVRSALESLVQSFRFLP